MSYDNSGRFGLWKNKDRKEQTHPHLGGQGEDLNSQGCWSSAWFAKDIADDDKKLLAEIVERHSQSSNKPFINVIIKKKESQAAQAQAAINDTTPVDDNFDEDIPF